MFTKQVFLKKAFQENSVRKRLGPTHAYTYINENKVEISKEEGNKTNK